jgi:hypothetical protein
MMMGDGKGINRNVTKTLITLYFMAGRTISNGADLRTAGYADPQCTINQAILKYTDVRQTQHYRNKRVDGLKLHLIIEDVLY